MFPSAEKKMSKKIYYHINNSILKDIYPIDVGYEEHSLNVKPFRNNYPYYLLHYVVGGEGSIEIDEITHTFNRYSVFILPPNKEITYAPGNKKPWKYYWINFNGIETKKILNTLGITPENYYFKFKDKTLTPYFEKALNLPENDIERIYTVTASLLNIFARLKPNLTGEIRKDTLKSFETVFAYIQDNLYSRELSAGSVANHFFISEGYFSLMFKKNLNTSFTKYVNYERIKKATSLLLTTDFSVKAIANTVGYNDPLYFSKVFKKYRLSSPQNYRSTHKKQT